METAHPARAAGGRGGRRASDLVAVLVVFLAPALLIYATFTIYPVLRTFYNSVHTIGPRNAASFVGLHNFTDLLTHDHVFWKAVGNTALFALVGTVADVAGGLLLALCLFSKAPLARVWRIVWFTPVLMSYVVVGIIWVWIYDYDWGALNLVLRWLGLGQLEHSWLGDPKTALWAVLVTHLWKWLGFNMIICLAALYALPDEVLGAAELDYCGWWAKLGLHHHADAAADPGQPAGAVVHRQDDGVRPGLDHDRRRPAVVDRDGLDLRLQARLQLEHLRSRLSVGDRGLMVRDDPGLRRC